MKFVGIYENGYSGCEERLYFEADNGEQVENYMKDGLSDYASSYEYLISDEIEDLDDDEDGEVDFYDTPEYEDYYNNCSYDITPATETDIEDVKMNNLEWIDLTEQ